MWVTTEGLRGAQPWDSPGTTCWFLFVRGALGAWDGHQHLSIHNKCDVRNASAVSPSVGQDLWREWGMEERPMPNPDVSRA